MRAAHETARRSAFDLRHTSPAFQHHHLLAPPARTTCSHHLLAPPDERSTVRFPKSGRRGSNPRHQAWKACALPAELLPQVQTPTSCIYANINHRQSHERRTLRHTLILRIPLRNGGGRIRTFEGLRRQIYSLLPLATWVPHLHRLTRSLANRCPNGARAKYAPAQLEPTKIW